MIVSDHQPFLFGHAGYWSKLIAADLHVASFDVPYSRFDHLAVMEIPGVKTALPLVCGGDRIADCIVGSPRKVLGTIEYQLLTKKAPFRDRIADIRGVLADAEGRSYKAVWLDLFEYVGGVLNRLGIDVPVVSVVEEPPTGNTVLERNASCILKATQNCKHNIVGPAYLDYRRPGETMPWPASVHRMNKPTKISLLWHLAFTADIRRLLGDYTLEAA